MCMKTLDFHGSALDHLPTEMPGRVAERSCGEVDVAVGDDQVAEDVVEREYETDHLAVVRSLPPAVSS